MVDPKPDDIPLKILICDADQHSARVLNQAIGDAAGVLTVKAVHTVEAAEAGVQRNGFNTIFVDPLSIGLDPASRFIFGIRSTIPEIVFVLYVDKAAAERRRKEFYKGTRHRFAHYYELDKQTPVGSFRDELATVLTVCRADLSWRMSAAQLALLMQEAKQLVPSRSDPSSQLLVDRLQELLNRLEPALEQKRPAAHGKRVFLSYRFAETEYVRGLTQLLQQSGFEVVTGHAANTYISKAVIERIRECDYFLCLMTPSARKDDGTYTASPWLLEEKGVALAVGKPIVLMVEESVTDFGGLQGDWQRIHFAQKGFLSAALQAVEQLKSYAGSTAV